MFINSYAELFDPHTNYFSPVNADRFEINMSKTFEGIGARLQQDVEYTTIFQIMPGGPAYRNKELEKGDRIIGVGQGEEGVFEDIIGWRLDDVVSKIKGPKGSVVQLLVLKKESNIDQQNELKSEINSLVNALEYNYNMESKEGEGEDSDSEGLSTSGEETQEEIDQVKAMENRQEPVVLDAKTKKQINNKFILIF